MGEVNIFNLCVSPHPNWGDWGCSPSFLMLLPPSFPTGGTPAFLMEEYSLPRSGWGYPFQGLAGGSTPFPSQSGGTPFSDLGRWYNPVLTWDLDRGCPQPEQHSVYLLHGRRYASCIHAGGLSCCLCDVMWIETRGSCRRNPKGRRSV